MFLHKTLRSSAGFSLVEILISIIIFVLGIVAVGLLTIDAQVSYRQGSERTQATLLAKEGLEAVRSMRDSDFDLLSTGNHGLAIASGVWTFSGSSDIQDNFTRVITISDIDIDTKQIVSTVDWQFTEARAANVSFTDYLTDWNQSHGTAGDLTIDTAGATLAAGDKELHGVTISNDSNSGITIDTIAAWWDGGSSIDRVRIDNLDVWSNQNGSPTPPQSSGTTLNIDNVSLPNNSGAISIDKFRFDSSIAGSAFLLKFVMTDDSTKYALIDEPGSSGEPPPVGNHADSLVVDISGVQLIGANKEVSGITLSDSGAENIIIDRMTVTWTGGANGNDIRGIEIDSSSVWSANVSSGTEIDISNHTLTVGAAADSLLLRFKKSMAGSTISITFTMSDASTKTISGITP
jgi:Tfp pilus assembly protein PilV